MTQTLTTTDQWLAEFGQALEQGDIDRAAGMFAEQSFWRDLIAFSWNIVTVEGPAGVRSLLEGTLEATRPTGWRTIEEPVEADGITTAWIAFETAVGRGNGLLRLRNDGAGPRAWTLLTALYELTGHEEPARARRPMGAEHGINRDRSTWLERREQEAAELGYTTQPEVLVVGGGQAGIALGARLRQLGVPTIIVDKRGRPGDQWRGRYKSLCLHDPVWYDHLPYIKFPDNWPVFSPKDKIADWLESYTRVMELNYWTNTEAKQASYDEAAGEWRVTVERDGQALVLRPRQLVLATGMSGKPNVPELPGMDAFRGDQHHSSQHPGPDAVQGQAVRGDRLEQLGLRHLRRALGGRRGRDDGAALVDAHRPVGHADGHRPRRALLRGGGRRRDDHREGGHDLRLAAVPDHARVPDPAVRPDARARRRDSTSGWRSPGSTTTGGRTGPGCS